MAVKQVFETYVYDPGLSSVGQMPFVLTRVSQARRGLRRDATRCSEENGGLRKGDQPQEEAGRTKEGLSEGVDQGTEHFV